jgi:hypothetical protein
MRNIRYFWVLALCVLLTPSLRAGDDAEAFYQKGMDNFLQGDYDNAILNAAKSLQVEPGFKKAQDLLSVLIVEKERGSQTEIWLGSKIRPAPEVVAVPTPDLSDIRRDILGLGERITVLEKRNPSSQLERRLQIFTAMIQKNDKENYLDLKNKQDNSMERMERLGTGQKALGLSLFWLFVLVTVSLVLSVWCLIRKKTEAPRLNIE